MHLWILLCTLLVYVWLHYISELVMRLVLIQSVRTRRARWCFAASLALATQLFLLVLWDLAALTGHGTGLDELLFRADGRRAVLAMLAVAPSTPPAASQTTAAAVASITAAHRYRVVLFNVSLGLLLVLVLVVSPLTIVELAFTNAFTGHRRGGSAAGGAGSRSHGRRMRVRRTVLALVLLLTVLWWLSMAPPSDVQPADVLGVHAATPSRSLSAALARLWPWLGSNHEAGKRRLLLNVPSELSPRAPAPKGKAAADPAAAARARLSLMQSIQRSHSHAHGHGEEGGEGNHHNDGGGGDTHKDAQVAPKPTAQEAGKHTIVRHTQSTPPFAEAVDEAGAAHSETESGAQHEEDAAVRHRPSRRDRRPLQADSHTRHTPGQHAPSSAPRVGQPHPAVGFPEMDATALHLGASQSRGSSVPWTAVLRGVTSRLAVAGVVLTGLLSGYAAVTTPFMYTMPYIRWRGKEGALRETQTALSKRQRHLLELYASKQRQLAQAQYAALHDAHGAAPARVETEASQRGGGGVASSVKSVWSSLYRAGGRAASSVAAAVHWGRTDVAQLAAESEGARFLSMTLFLQADGVGHVLAEAQRGNTCVGPLYAFLGVLFAAYSLVKTLMTVLQLVLFRYSTRDSVSVAVDWLHFFAGPHSGVADVVSSAIQTLVLLVNGWMITTSIRSLLLTLLQLTVSVAGGGVLSRADGFTIVLAMCVGTYFIGQLVLLRQQLPEPTPPTSTDSALPWWLASKKNVLLEVLGSLPVHYYQRLNNYGFLLGLAATGFARRFVLRDPATQGIDAVA